MGEIRDAVVGIGVDDDLLVIIRQTIAVGVGGDGGDVGPGIAEADFVGLETVIVVETGKGKTVDFQIEA